MTADSSEPRGFRPLDPQFRERVRASFARQAALQTIGARLAAVEPGEVTIELPFRADLTQQHGFIHAGIVATVLDSACGYAALSLMAPGTAVLSVEYKVNLLSPARGTRFRAIGRVVRPGRTLTVCTGELLAEGPGADKQVAMMVATMATRDGTGLID